MYGCAADREFSVKYKGRNVQCPIKQVPYSCGLPSVEAPGAEVHEEIYVGVLALESRLRKTYGHLVGARNSSYRDRGQF